MQAPVPPRLPLQAALAPIPHRSCSARTAEQGQRKDGSKSGRSAGALLQSSTRCLAGTLHPACTWNLPLPSPYLEAVAEEGGDGLHHTLQVCTRWQRQPGQEAGGWCCDPESFGVGCPVRQRASAQLTGDVLVVEAAQLADGHAVDAPATRRRDGSGRCMVSRRAPWVARCRRRRHVLVHNTATHSRGCKCFQRVCTHGCLTT